MPTLTPQVCATYDNIFTIRKAEVIAFIKWWECDPAVMCPTVILIRCACLDVEMPNNEIMARINAWPGNGDVHDLESRSVFGTVLRS